jgi:(2Fe-2S) ferredoxin
MSKAKYRVYICCGPNCGPKDSRSLLDYLSVQLREQDLDAIVSALPTGCQAHCLSGPTMVVYPGPVYYQEMTEGRMDRVISSHFLADEPVEEYFWTGKKLRILPDGTIEKPRDPRSDAARSYNDEPEPPTRRRKRPVEDVDDFKW